MYVSALEGNLRKAVGVYRNESQPGPQNRTVFLEREEIPSSHVPHLWARCTHQARTRETLTDRAASSASASGREEMQKSINPTFTVAIRQPSSPGGQWFLSGIPAAGITRSSCSKSHIPGHHVKGLMLA